MPSSLDPAAREPFDSTVFGNRAGRFRRKFQAALLWTCLFAGTAITCYRTDVLLAGARGLRMEAQYLELEKRWLGGVPGGTPREAQAWAAVAPPSVNQVGASPVASDASGGGAVLPLTEPPPPAASAPALPAVGSSAPEAPPASALVSPAELPPASHGDRQAVRLTLPLKPASKVATKASEKASSGESPAVAPAPGSEDFLRASMRNAVERPVAKKEQPPERPAKKKKSATFDPLNGDL